MNTTIAEEAIIAERNSEEGAAAVFKGRNFIRFVIAGWPKVVQQFVGLSVFNTYATYFCRSSGPLPSFILTNSASSPIRGQQKPILGNSYPLLRPARLHDSHCHIYRPTWSSALNCVPLCSNCSFRVVFGYHRLFRLYQTINKFTFGMTRIQDYTTYSLPG